MFLLICGLYICILKAGTENMLQNKCDIFSTLYFKNFFFMATKIFLRYWKEE